ncbi:MAG TPA: type II toxin-antitoxin system VapB family antitoxin [Acidobacteriaceae bacterium]|jgi:antitoxin VapB
MSLNIKSDEAHDMARRLSELTGESMTGAVIVALSERLERVQKRRKEGMAARLLAVADQYSAKLPEPWRSLDHAALLYDEKGLPK